MPLPPHNAGGPLLEHHPRLVSHLQEVLGQLPDEPGFLLHLRRLRPVGPEIVDVEGNPLVEVARMVHPVSLGVVEIEVAVRSISVDALK